MNRREEARARMEAIENAARTGEPPPIDPAAIEILKKVIAPDDPLRLYQLATSTVVEVYVNDAGDEAAARLIAERWAAHVEWTTAITERGPVPLDPSLYAGAFAQ